MRTGPKIVMAMAWNLQKKVRTNDEWSTYNCKAPSFLASNLASDYIEYSFFSIICLLLVYSLVILSQKLEMVVQSKRKAYTVLYIIIKTFNQ